MKTDFKKHKELTRRLEKFQKKGESIKLKSTLKEKTNKKDLSLQIYNFERVKQRDKIFKTNAFKSRGSNSGLNSELKDVSLQNSKQEAESNSIQRSYIINKRNYDLAERIESSHKSKKSNRSF